MDENTNVAVEETANQQDDFLSGFSDDSDVTVDTGADQHAEENGNETDAGAETAEADTATATQEAESDAEGAEVENAEAPEKQPEPEASWDVNFMGNTRKLTAKDITPELLQKGLDYDRVREKYDEQKPAYQLLSELAKKANMGVTEYARFIRTESKKAQGMTDDEAKRTIDLEDREAAVSEKEREDSAAKQAKDEQSARVARDLDEFSKAFPDAFKQAKDDPKAIPQEVWDAMKRDGLSLTSAYARHYAMNAKKEAEQAKLQAQASVQNSKNAERSTGSMKTAGADASAFDDFLKGFSD